MTYQSGGRPWRVLTLAAAAILIVAGTVSATAHALQQSFATPDPQHAISKWMALEP